MKKSTLLLCAIATALNVSAHVGETFASGDINYQVTSENGTACEVMVLSPISADITTATIPSKVINGGNSYNVTGVTHKAFESCKSLKKATLPTSLVWIGAYAFRECASLTAIDIPSSVVSIGRQAFAGCTSLGSATLGAAVERMGDGVFLGCTTLKTVNLAQGCSKLAEGMFELCASLSSIDIPDGIVTIGDYAMAGCTICSLSIPTETKQIGEGAFAFNEKLTTAGIPNSVEGIGCGAFLHAASLAHITLPSWLTTLGENEGEGVFDGCGKMTELTIPAYVDDMCHVATISTWLTSIYVMGDHIPEGLSMLPTTNAEGEPITIYVKKSVFEEKYADGEWRGHAVNYRIPITMTNAKGNGVKYKTLCRDFDIDLSETNIELENGIQKLGAYIAPDADEGLGIVFMEELLYIPSRLRANEEDFQGEDEYVGIVLKGTPGATYFYQIGENDYTQGAGQWMLEDATAAANHSPWNANLMRGANDTKLVSPTESDAATGKTLKNYGLSNNAFHAYSATGWIGYNKAFLSIPEKSAQANITMMFTDADGTTDSITLEEFASQCDEGDAYDLSGRHVDESHKGIIIQNGKKQIR